MFDAVATERRSIATMVESLSADQLATESLCAGWDVKTVAAHLVSDFTDGFWGFLLAASGTATSIAELTRWPAVGRRPPQARSPTPYGAVLIASSVRP